MSETSYRRLAAVLLALWFVFALTGSALHLFVGNPNLPPIALGLSATLPVIIFLIWFATSAGWRDFLLGLNPRTLVYVQSLRLMGYVFLVLFSVGLLPGFMALPAGWGDIAIGVTAPLVAAQLTSPARRGGFIAWQLLGMTDLVTAVTLGATARFIDPQSTQTSIMAVLPMSLIPTFLVPVFFILHIICIAQALRWKTEQAFA
jgi:hypothetical protein